MIVCFNCPPKIKAILDRLVRKEGYEDISQAIVSAVENLDVLTEQISNRASLVLNGQVPSTSVRESMAGDDRDRESRGTAGTKAGNLVGVPSIFAKPSRSESTFAEDNEVRQRSGLRPVPHRYWLFGMYNKLLPLKASCRAIANTIIDHFPGGVPITEVPNLSAAIAEDAQVLGASLRRHDKTYGLNRDNAISLGFPSSGKDEKSRRRFAKQFVARLSKGETLTGFPYHYGFVSLTRTNVPLLCLTKAGWEFASIPNPVLDHEQESQSQKLSEAECSFLMHHIRKYVPAEWWLFQRIMDVLGEKELTAKEIDDRISDIYEPRLNPDPSLATARSGAMSRMGDIGLVARIRQGVSMAYILTEEGRSLGTGSAMNL